MSTLEELTTPATRQEIEEAIYAAIAARGAKTTGWKPGSVVRTIITGIAIVASGFSQLQALLAKSGFLELAEGVWLTLVAQYVYGVPRDTGAFATGPVVVSNASGFVYSFDPGDLVVVNGQSGKTYRNTELVEIDALEEDVVVQVQAVELGTGSNAPAGDIDGFETVHAGLTVTNEVALLGRDVEEDPELRTRCLEKLGTLSPNGPRDAYSFVCRSAKREDGSSIGITRVRSIADGEGNIDVYVADADGNTISGPDLAILQEEIETKCEPLAVTATVVGAAAVEIDIAYELWVRDTSGLTNDQIVAIVQQRIGTFLGSQPIGGLALTPGGQGYVFVSALETIIGSAASTQGSTDGLREVRVVVTVPAADVEIDPTEAPVAGTVTAVAIHQISAGVL